MRLWLLRYMLKYGKKGVVVAAATTSLEVSRPEGKVLTSLSMLSDRLRFPPRPPPPLPLPRGRPTLPLPLSDTGVEAEPGVLPAPVSAGDRATPPLPRPRPLPRFTADPAEGIGSLSLVTMLFNTCSLAASYPGVPGWAAALARARARSSAVVAE